MPMDERAKRIVDTAIELAERDGFAAVRLRDVAASAQVALGTVYKRFSSKEEILIAALEQESEQMLAGMGRRKPTGKTALDRVNRFFEAVTKGLTRKPNLARALMKSVASGDPNITEKVASFHALLTGLTIAAIRGEAANDWNGEATAFQRNAAMVLQHVWFSTLVGWAGGLHDVSTSVEQVQAAAGMLLADVDR